VDRPSDAEGNDLGSRHEPSGVARRRFAYVADTNAHRIAAVELASGEVALDITG
jgi:hypothetical protein